MSDPSNREMACGAPSEAELTDELRGHLEEALSQHNASSNEEKKVLVRVTKVLQQVVAGMKYTFELVAAGESSGTQYSCKAVVLSQPWVDPKPQILSFTATPAE